MARKKLWDAERIREMLERYLSYTEIMQSEVEVGVLEMRDEYEKRISELLDAIDSIDRAE